MKSVLITGCAGFIGFHLARHYLNAGLTVTGLDNFMTGSRSHIEYLTKNYRSFRFYEVDICENWQDSLTETFDVVFHLASPASVQSFQKFPLETMRANSIGLENTLRHARTQMNCRVVFASTSEIYGSPLVTPQPESYWGHVNPFGPRSCYDEAKRFGEALIYSTNKKFSSRHGVVRIFNTYGPGMSNDDDRVINSFLRAALNNKALRIFGSGKQTRSFCYIEDLIKGLDLYARSELTEPVNLGNDTELSIDQLAREIISLTNSSSVTEYCKAPEDDPPERRPDLSKARTELGYEASISLQEGLRKTIDSLSAFPR